MASQARTVAPDETPRPSGKARGVRLVTDADVSRQASRSEVVSDVVEAQWLSLVRWLGDKNTKGDKICLKAERMVDALIRGGVILSDKATADDRRTGFPDLIGLKHARIKVFINKSIGTNKSRPIYATAKLTDMKLLWACHQGENAPNPIGYRESENIQIPHLLITIYANWVRELPDDRAREGWLFDVLKTISWKGEEALFQPFELVGRDIVVNEDTIALYGPAINDTLVARRGMKSHGAQLSFPSEAINPQDTYEKLRAWMKDRDALLYRQSDGAVIDGDGDVVFYAEKTRTLEDPVPAGENFIPGKTFTIDLPPEVALEDPDDEDDEDEDEDEDDEE